MDGSDSGSLLKSVVELLARSVVSEAGGSSFKMTSITVGRGPQLFPTWALCRTACDTASSEAGDLRERGTAPKMGAASLKQDLEHGKPSLLLNCIC